MDMSSVNSAKPKPVEEKRPVKEEEAPQKEAAPEETRNDEAVSVKLSSRETQEQR